MESVDWMDQELVNVRHFANTEEMLRSFHSTGPDNIKLSQQHISKVRLAVAYISGHLNVSLAEFFEHYVPKIEVAMKRGHRFVMGDARGVDNQAAAMLQRVFQESPEHLQMYDTSDLNDVAVVYHMYDSPRIVTKLPCIGGFQSDEERDMAMTLASDYDIAWVRPGRENSGTAKNVARRTKFNEARNKRGSIAHDWSFKTVEQLEEYKFQLEAELAMRKRANEYATAHKFKWHE